MLILILTVVCVLTYSFEIVFGLAGTIMMLPLMSVFIDSKTLVIYSVLPQVLVGIIGLFRSPKTVDIRFLIFMLLFAIFGAVVGLSLFYFFSLTTFHRLLASAITLFGLYLVLMPSRFKINSIIGRALDTLAGASQALFGISGPIAMTRLLGTFEEKIVIRNYALAFFLSLNVFRLTAYLFKGTVTQDIAEMMLISSPFLIVALWFANHLHFKINETLFRKVVSWIILLGGIGLFFTMPSNTLNLDHTTVIQPNPIAGIESHHVIANSQVN